MSDVLEFHVAAFWYNLFLAKIDFFFLKKNTIVAQNAIKAVIAIPPKSTLFLSDSINGLSHEVMRLPSRFH